MQSHHNCFESNKQERNISCNSVSFVKYDYENLTAWALIQALKIERVQNFKPLREYVKPTEPMICSTTNQSEFKENLFNSRLTLKVSNF